MSTIDWIKELAQTDQQVEEFGAMDVHLDDIEAELENATISLLKKIKAGFIGYISTFNKLRGLSAGGVKVYGIANTEADFMLFRNSCKLVFSSTTSGEINIKFYHNNTHMSISSGTNQDISDAVLTARQGAFGQIVWAHKEQLVSIEYLTKYYMTLFIKHSKRYHML